MFAVSPEVEGQRRPSLLGKPGRDAQHLFLAAPVAVDHGAPAARGFGEEEVGGHGVVVRRSQVGQSNELHYPPLSSEWRVQGSPFMVQGFSSEVRWPRPRL